MVHNGFEAQKEAFGDQRIAVSLLDGFRVMCNGSQIDLPSVGARLVAYLALQQRPIARGVVAGTLWPETTQDRAQASLRSALWRVRRAHSGIVRSGRDCVGLEEWVDVDTHTLLSTSLDTRAGSRGRHQPDDTVSRLSGELLPDWYDDWIVFERERFRLLALQALEGLSRSHIQAGEYAAAIECALGAVHLEPLRESAQRTLMEVHLAQGNVAEAVRQYRSYRDRLRDELGVEPSSHMIELLESAGLHSAVVDAA